MWKPTKAGVYLLDRSLVCITQPGCSAIEMVASNSTTVINKTLAPYGLGADMVGDKWSLLAPDWQEGDISDAQSRKWRHWAFLTSTEPPFLIAGRWSDGLHKTCLPSGDCLSDVIAKSAPIQPDLSNGPLWVPLEVAK